MARALARYWAKTCMLLAGRSTVGRLFAAAAGLGLPPYKGRRNLARLSERGYIAPTAEVHGAGVRTGRHVFIGDRVTLFQGARGGEIHIADRSAVHRDSIFETGEGGSIEIGCNSHLQAHCHLSAYKGSIRIGNGVQVAPGCAFYPYDHGTATGIPMREQPFRSKGDIVIGDDVWLGYGVVVLNGAKVGAGAVIGAGSVVTREIPSMAIAVGSPARVVGYREGAESPQELPARSESGAAQ